MGSGINRIWKHRDSCNIANEFVITLRDANLIFIKWDNSPFSSITVVLTDYLDKHFNGLMVLKTSELFLVMYYLEGVNS